MAHRCKFCYTSLNVKNKHEHIKNKEYRVSMKYILALTAFVLPALAPTFAQATQVKENSVVCISQKNLARYELLKANHQEEFIKAMEGKAECVTMLSPFDVVVLSKVGNYANVERVDGMKLWVKTDAIED